MQLIFAVELKQSGQYESLSLSMQDLRCLSNCGFFLVWLELCACHCPTLTTKVFLHLNGLLTVLFIQCILCDLKSFHSCTFGLQIRDYWNIAVKLQKFVRKICFKKWKHQNSLLQIKMGAPFVWNWKKEKP